jgi:hypothetical protein
MEPELIWQNEAESLMLVHGTGAIGALVSRISDAVRLSDDQAVHKLDHMLQLVEARLEEPWRLPVARSD